MFIEDATQKGLIIKEKDTFIEQEQNIELIFLEVSGSFDFYKKRAEKLCLNLPLKYKALELLKEINPVLSESIPALSDGNFQLQGPFKNDDRHQRLFNMDEGMDLFSDLNKIRMISFALQEEIIWDKDSVLKGNRKDGFLSGREWDGMGRTNLFPFGTLDEDNDPGNYGIDKLVGAGVFETYYPLHDGPLSEEGCCSQSNSDIPSSKRAEL